ASLETIEPTGKRTLIALDVSSSMACGSIAGVPGFTPRIGSAAMALVAAATETHHQLVAFTAPSTGYGGKWGGGTSGITPLTLPPRARLSDAVAAVGDLPFGGTDCALPMIWAKHNNVDVDTFVVYTDGE